MKLNMKYIQMRKAQNLEQTSSDSTNFYLEHFFLCFSDYKGIRFWWYAGRAGLELIVTVYNIILIFRNEIYESLEEHVMTFSFKFRLGISSFPFVSSYKSGMGGGGIMNITLQSVSNLIDRDEGILWDYYD